MSYVSGYFFALVFVAFSLYWVIPAKYRWWIILLANIIFLVFNASVLQVIVFLAMILFTYISGIWIACEERWGLTKRNRFVISTCLILLPLIAIRIEKTTWWFNGGVLSRWIPIGLSFWALEMIIYIHGIYANDMEPCRNFLKTVCYYTYFPKVVQGPIEDYGKINLHGTILNISYTSRKFEYALQEMIAGMFLKLVVAERAKIIVDKAFENWMSCSTAILWLAAILYSVQIYTDFLGCMKIVYGSSLLFGIKLSNNFIRPYLSGSITDFWRRWHITLSNLLKQFIYIPLGGNRKGFARKCVNIMAVFFVSGLWHGGGLTFIVWGLMHGLYQLFEQIMSRYFDMKKNSLFRMFPLLRYHDRWDELESEDIIPGYLNYLKEYRGYKYVTDTIGDENDYNPFTIDKEPVEHFTEEKIITCYTDKIVTLCRKENIKLLFVRTPYTNANSEEYLILQRYAENNGIDYIDFNEISYYTKIQYSFGNDSFDSDHANANGATKMTKYIGEILRRDYDL